jgi:hypothetical protein
MEFLGFFLKSMDVRWMSNAGWQKLATPSRREITGSGHAMSATAIHSSHDQ